MDGYPYREERIGRVVSVSGSQVVILLENTDDERDKNAHLTSQIGALVKTYVPGATVFGMITGMSIPIPAQEPGQKEMRVVELDLLGESVHNQDGSGGAFQRGVSAYPALGDGIYAASQEDLAKVYFRPSESTVRIGTVYQDRSLPAVVSIDDLLGKHMAILGTTGSGKSCATALVLNSILEQHQHAHIMLLDPHNEYSQAFGSMAETVGPANLQLPYWLFTLEEFAAVVLGVDARQAVAETKILGEAVLAAKKAFATTEAEMHYIWVDTPVPYRMSTLMQLLDNAMGKLDKPEKVRPYMTVRTRLEALRSDARFAFMFGDLAVRDKMAQIIGQFFRIPAGSKPITILDLSIVPSEVLNVTVSVLCRMAFDFALWSDRQVPIMLVCEEAHRYAPQDIDRGFEPTKRAISRIAKEGRKYGLSLCVVSQRPSELASEILSQCNTIFAMRLTSQRDQDFVRNSMSEPCQGLIDSLASLRNAEAIAVGEGLPVPVRVCFDPLPDDRRPRSGTAAFSMSWKKEGAGLDFVEQVVDRWRRQGRSAEYLMEQSVALPGRPSAGASPAIEPAPKAGAGQPAAAPLQNRPAAQPGPRQPAQPGQAPAGNGLARAAQAPAQAQPQPQPQAQPQPQVREQSPAAPAAPLDPSQRPVPSIRKQPASNISIRKDT